MTKRRDVSLRAKKTSTATATTTATSTSAGPRMAGSALPAWITMRTISAPANTACTTRPAVRETAATPVTTSQSTTGTTSSTISA